MTAPAWHHAATPWQFDEVGKLATLSPRRRAQAVAYKAQPVARIERPLRRMRNRTDSDTYRAAVFAAHRGDGAMVRRLSLISAGA